MSAVAEPTPDTMSAADATFQALSQLQDVPIKVGEQPAPLGGTEPDPAPAPEAKPAAAAPTPEPARTELDAELEKAKASLGLPEPAKTEAPVVEDILKDEAPKGVAENTSKHWKSFKDKANAEIRLREQKIKELESKLTAAPQAVPNDEVERLRKERDEFSARLERTALEQHPVFQAKFVAGREQIVNDAKAIIGAGEVGDRVASLLALPDSPFRNQQIDAAMGDMTELQKATLSSAVLQLRRIDTERSQVLANHKPVLQQLQAQEQDRRAQAKEIAKKQFESAVKEAQESGHEFFRTVEGNNDWNQQVGQTVKLAQDIFLGNHDDKALASYSLKAAGYDRIVDLNVKLRHLVQLQDRKLQEYKSAEPGVGKGGSSAPAPGDENLTMGEAVVRQMQAAGIIHT